MLDGTEYFECHCYFDEHTIRFVLNFDGDESNPPEIYTSVFLANHRNVFQRIWLAVKYVFGYQCKYGAFGNWTMLPKDCGRFENMLINYRKAYLEWANKYPEAAEQWSER